MNLQQLEKRVIEIANRTLQEKGYVCCLDVLLGIGWLQPIHVEDWRKGLLPYLEQAIQANLNKLSHGMKCFRQWANKCGLKPSETKYLARTRDPKRELQFSKSGHLDIEQHYRTHYLSPILSQKKQENLKAQLDKPPSTWCFVFLKNRPVNNVNKLYIKITFYIQSKIRRCVCHAAVLINWSICRLVMQILPVVQNNTAKPMQW